MKKELQFANTHEAYPYNLLRAVAYRTRLELPNSLSKDVLAGLSYALFTLPENAQKLVQLRFQQGLSPETTFRIMDLPAQQLLTLEADAIRKLRIPSRWECIRLGLARYIKEKAAKAYNRGFQEGYRAGIADSTAGRLPQTPPEDILNLPLACAGFSQRILSALQLNHFLRLGDIVHLDHSQILTLRGIGSKSLREIAQVLRHNRITGTAWDVYLWD